MTSVSHSLTRRTIDVTSSIYLKQVELGPMANYVYFVGDPHSREVAVVDPAWDVDRIVDMAQETGSDDHENSRHPQPLRSYQWGGSSAQSHQGQSVYQQSGSGVHEGCVAGSGQGREWRHHTRWGRGHHLSAYARSYPWLTVLFGAESSDLWRYSVHRRLWPLRSPRQQPGRYVR